MAGEMEEAKWYDGCGEQCGGGGACGREMKGAVISGFYSAMFLVLK